MGHFREIRSRVEASLIKLGVDLIAHVADDALLL